MARKFGVNLEFSLFRFGGAARRRSRRLSGLTPPKPKFSGLRNSPPHSLASGFSSGDFKTSFLQFMSEAGARLGQAAADEIAKAGGGKDGENKPQGSGEQLYKQKQQEQTDRLLFPTYTLFGKRFRANVPPEERVREIFSILGHLSKVATSLIASAPGMAVDIAESQRRFAAVSPSMMGVFAESGVRGVQRDIVSGEKLAPSNRDLLRELDRFRGSAAQVTDKLTEIKNLIATEVMTGINSVAGPLVEWLLGRREQVDGLPFFQKFQQMQGNEAGRRENRLAHAMKFAPQGWGVEQDPQTGAVNFIPPPNFIGPPLPPWGGPKP